jgi:16S rRNA (guanine527-N7)-methyltransferase
MSHPLWQQLARDAGTALTNAQTQQLDRYLDELVAWNQKLNLTRIADRADAEVKHIADALTLLRFLPAPRAKPSKGVRVREPTLADVGTGGGVPGVPLAIARPDFRVTLIDATKKKLTAIEQMVTAVGITNVTTRHARVETVSERFDVITARGVADLDTLLGWCLPLMHRQSVFLALKGPRATEEIAGIHMSRRKQVKIDVTPIEAAELAGHCVVRMRLTEG